MAKIRSIRSAVTALTNSEKDKLRESEIYESQQMQNYLKDLSGMICNDYFCKTNITVVSDSRICETACTNGTNLFINWNSDVCRFFTTPEDRFIAFMGLFWHEHGHILYNDFDTDERAMKFIEKGHFYGAEPETTTLEEENALIDLKNAMSNRQFTALFMSLYSYLDNVVADPHDEGKIMEEFGGLAKESILKVREAIRSYSESVEEEERQVKAGTASKLSAMTYLIFEFLRFGRVLYEDEKTEQNSEYAQCLRKVAAAAEIARWTDDVKFKFTQLNKIVLALWPFIRDELYKSQSKHQSSGQNTQNGQQPQQCKSGTQQQKDGHVPNQNSQSENKQGSGGQGQSQTDSQPTEEQIQSILNQIQQAASKSQITQAPTGQSSKQAKANAQAAREGKQSLPKTLSPQPGCMSDSQNAMSGILDQIQSSIAQEKAETSLEKQQGKNIQNDAEKTFGENSPHSGIPVQVRRVISVARSDIARYEEEMKDISLYSKRLQRQLLEIMRDMRMGGLMRHRAFGQIICVQDTYRADELFFENKKQPIDLPDMAICVLVDHSGSMQGKRIEMSMKAAMLLHDFASGIGIPISVCGHHTNGDTVKYIVYTDYDSYSIKDKYRLAKMNAIGCNRDGAAIEISASRLQKRPEKLKLLIVISDGQPNHKDYRGTCAEEDIQNIIKHYNRKGIEVVGAAIGDDRETISRIYGDGYLDIDDLSKLPKILTQLVRKRLLSKIY